jgi:hypothetical protein
MILTVRFDNMKKRGKTWETSQTYPADPPATVVFRGTLASFEPAADDDLRQNFAVSVPFILVKRVAVHS